MFSRIALFSTLLAALSVVRADIEPSEPSPGNIYNEGATCHIAWTPDTTGTWKTMYIELMTGSNKAMVHLTTVATVDGTDATNATFDYPCPAVIPNSAIYFYQFTSPDSPNTLWTGRFAIADKDGNTTPPPNATQPEGDPIPWGLGALEDPSLATPAPPKGSGVTVAPSSSASISASSASAPTVSVSSTRVTAAVSSSSGITRVSSSSSSASHTSSASANATGAAASNNGALAGIAIDTRLMQAAASLGAVAFAFAIAL